MQKLSIRKKDGSGGKTLPLRGLMGGKRRRKIPGMRFDLFSFLNEMQNRLNYKRWKKKTTPKDKFFIPARTIGKFSISILLACSLLLGTCAVATSGMRSIMLDFDGTVLRIKTLDATVGELFERYSIQVGQNDQVVPGLDQPLADGMGISIRRAMDVLIISGTQAQHVCLLSGTVEDALESCGIALNEDDEVFPQRDTLLYAGMMIEIDKVERETQAENRVVDYRTVTKKTDTMYMGESYVAQEGVNGVRTLVTRVTYRNGSEVRREIVSDRITTAAVDKVIYEGSKSKSTPKPPKAATSKPASTSKPAVDNPSGSGGGTITVNGKTIEYKKVYEGKATAYTGTGSHTYTGTVPDVGTIAVDPDQIPLGTRLYIPGYGFGVAQDIGNNPFDSAYWVDVFMSTSAECEKWGIKNVKIYILK